MNNKLLNKLSFVLVIIGGLNWGLVGILNIDLVAKLFGADAMLSQVIYTLIGLSAVYMIVNCKKCCKE
ncbi:DUF378 domain-containing protein [Patescibacteria group bacterium]|nr:DUF378 domain-containing protein [Patescibacteria group bacterium]MBU4367828.1 DUF378 domain-containing protein [Patescibacteria group bacterium]MBU4461961.1 DUF378 domain-containing protein [Patescibacteria group bacterium]MCG2700380.1 DUF378 domain-containing protein [Candidatus Parcubacteria bacterium]